MSRKSREDKSEWKLPSLYAFVGDYSPFRTKGYDPIGNTLVWFHNSWAKDEEGIEDNGRHPMYPLAGGIQEELLMRDRGQNPNFSTVLVIDIKDMFETKDEYEDALTKEIETVELTKAFGKRMLRICQRLLLRQVIVATEGKLCAVLLKLYQALHRLDDSSNATVSAMWLMHPQLSTKYINTHLVIDNVDEPKDAPKFPVPLNLVHKRKKSKSRLSALKYFYPNVDTELIKTEEEINNWFSIVGQYQDSEAPPQPYCPDYYNDFGKTLFMSIITVEMNRHTKQYERNCDDFTSALMEVHATEKENVEAYNWSNPQRHIGALVLRGNRCILARSLSQEWEGMRIPSVIPKPSETPSDAAIRAFMEYTEAEADEVQVLQNVLPVAIYAPDDRSIMVELYPLYVTSPPPDGPLEDADMEDDEDLYDWYTYPNAITRLDKASISALQTMALNMYQAASVGLVPTKWGGIFGQELQVS